MGVLSDRSLQFCPLGVQYLWLSVVPRNYLQVLLLLRLIMERSFSREVLQKNLQVQMLI